MAGPEVVPPLYPMGYLALHRLPANRRRRAGGLLALALHSGEQGVHAHWGRSALALPPRPLYRPRVSSSDMTGHERTTPGSAHATREHATTEEVLVSGVQALARLPMDQRRADAAAGLRTGGLVTG